MVKAEVQRMLTGYIVKVTGKGAHPMYLAKAYKGNYMYMLDYAFAKKFRDKKTAIKHAKAIERREENDKDLYGKR